MKITNPIFLADSYKITHWKQQPPGTTNVYSYLESRGGKYSSTLFFGLQYYLREYLEGQIVTHGNIEEAIPLLKDHFFGQDHLNHEGWRHIVDDHQGRLPIEIKAPEEGTLIPVSNVLITVENTCPKCFWVTNFVETLLVKTWYPITVATISYNIRQLIQKYLEETGDPSGLEFKLHDFGYRGVSSNESAVIGGMAHLVNFLGTDNLGALYKLKEYYYPTGSSGNSIPAAEHSTITSWGEANEMLAYANMLHQYPEGYVAVVSDSYDIVNAVQNIWGKQLSAIVLNRKGTVVIRPDSGNPPDIVLQVIDLLGTSFGFENNSKGYKVLDPHVRVIQGDGIEQESIEAILANLKTNKWSTDNVTFGMGGALLQKMDRDTQNMAFKCSSIVTRGLQHDVYKRPVTDLKKLSKRGRFKLILKGGQFRTASEYESGEDLLETVFYNGDIKRLSSFESIREKAQSKNTN